jgi:hypothetical protein
MTNRTTLFSRYKNLINSKWADGERTYTASELNNYVGAWECPTSWKRANNNPFYTTRTYQTELKELGCITMIKRGLWQINAPIPEWFGSFHFRGLKGGFDPSNQYADHTCEYWKSLPANHKVNPWKNIDPMRVMANVQPLDLNDPADRAQYMNTNNAEGKVSHDFTMYTISGVPVTSKVPGLTATYMVNVWSDNHAPGAAAEVVDSVFYIDGKDVGDVMMEMLVDTLSIKLTDIAEIAQQRAINTYTAAYTAASKPTEKMYTEAQVMQILREYNQDMRIYIERAFDLSDDTPFFTLHDLSDYE